MSDNEPTATDDVNPEKGAIGEEIDANITVQVCSPSIPNESGSDDQADIADFVSETVEERNQIEENRTEATGDSRQKEKFSFSSIYHFVMRKHWAELCLSAGLLLAVLSSLIDVRYAMKARLLQRKAPAPVRFFPRNSLVTDFHDGNGLDLHKLLSMQSQRYGSTGVLFVMYYAPWCARSMEARWHMDNLARYFYPASIDLYNGTSSSASRTQSIGNGPVHFIAVNCWEPNGQCRRSYKLYSYPVFLAYPGTANGIYYNGVLSSDYTFRFLENVISPVIRLQSREELSDFFLDSKTAAIGYFDFRSSRKPFGYESFYIATLKALERDPMRAAIKFAIITSAELALSLNFTRNGQIKVFRLLNDTLEYPQQKQFNAKSISAWLFENLLNPVRWVSPSVASAGKSDALHEFLTRRPTMILFAPRQPLFDYSPYYTLLTDIALRYFDCGKPSDETLHLRSISESVKQLYLRQNKAKSDKRHLNDFCLRTLREEIRLLNDCCADISQSSADGQRSLYDYRQRNICHVCYPTQVQRSFQSRPALPPQLSFCERFFSLEDFPNTMTTAAKEFLMPILSSRSCDRLVNDFLPKSSVIDYCCRHDDKDGAGADQVVKRFRKRIQRSTTASPRSETGNGRGRRSPAPNCEKLRLSRLLGYINEEDVVHLDNSAVSNSPEWLGLSCRTNRTLQFAAMDINHYAVFARKLGLAPNTSTSMAVIFDDLKEAVYVMDGPLTADRLGNFVVDFTYSRLSRFYRTDNSRMKSANYSAVVSRSIGGNCSPGSICIRSVTSATFESVVMDPKKDVLLLYTASWCGSCQRLFHVYQTLAYYFRAVADEIAFAQMDVTNNDLRWHFTIDKIPALIFFPAERKSESVAFPGYAPWTLPNLVAFVTAHCRRDTRLRFALSTCVKNATSDDTAADSRCLIRNRYRTWRQLFRVERRIRYLELEIDQSIQRSKWDWDHDDNDVEWRVYLQRSWLELSRLQLQARALRTLLTDALRRSHFEAKAEQV